MARLVVLLLTFCLLFASGCRSSKESGPPPIGEAYVGPVTLVIRKELGLKSGTAATVKHGERLDVLGTRRRFVRVRTNEGVVGWVDSRNLISTEQMQALRAMSEAAAKMPAQAYATVYEPLNIHAEPVRASPSFAQITEGMSVAVLAHKIAPRNAKPEAKPVIVPPKPAGRKATRSRDRKKDRGTSSRVPPPPLPAPPPPPPNWLAMSQNAAPDPGMEEETRKEAPPPKPVPIDDWSFIRTQDGKAGWVLTRMLTMSIPDEVAQYAEGQRITSYFPLADVQDEGQTRHFWLWTTISTNGVPYEFDSFRVFIWSLRRHRYETAYIERGVVGYYPVQAVKGTGERGEGATFTLILEDENDQLVRKTYVFNGYRVSLARTEPYQPPSHNGITPGMPATPQADASGATKPGLLDRIKGWFKR